MRNHHKKSPRAGFTLIEMFVVMVIIAVLTCIILPVVWVARHAELAMACQSHERVLINAFLAFASDHDNHLPGNFFDCIHPTAGQPQTNPAMQDWMLGADPNAGNNLVQVLDGPQNGTLFPYVNDKGTYLCPEYQTMPVNAGYGTNGHFDYAAFLTFSGAAVTHISPTTQFRYPLAPLQYNSMFPKGVSDGNSRPTAQTTYTEYATPVIVEEEPAGGVNGGNVEAGHANTDRIAHYHRGGGHYASIDGSVHWFIEPLDADCWNWYSLAPSKQWVTLGAGFNQYGYWDAK